MGTLRITGQAVSSGITNGDAKDAKAAVATALAAAKAAAKSGATTTVNGRTYTGRTVSVQGDGVYVNGRKVD